MRTNPWVLWMVPISSMVAAALAVLVAPIALASSQSAGDPPQATETASGGTEPAATPEPEDTDWEIGWKDSFFFNSPDGHFKLKLGGRVHADWAFPDAEDGLEEIFGEIEDASELRRGRLFLSGLLYGNVEFKLQYELSGGDVEAKDVYIGFRDTPIGNIRIGHFKEAFSLEELTSSNDLSFLERSLPITLAPVRNTGIQVSDRVGERFTWAVGAFRETDGLGFSDGDGKLNLTGRLTGLPIYRDGGRRLLHLGIGLSRKDLGDAPLRFSQRPENHLAPRFLDTGSLPASEALIAGVELALVSGPFWASAEMLASEVDATQLGDPSVGGYTVQAGYFLTGEHRPYKTSSGVFARVRPRQIFSRGGGSGAWEIAVRASHLDLQDARIDGGEAEGFSLALNWYLNSASRVLLNYVSNDRDGVGDIRSVLLRLQVVF